jgi:hypothetical protein
MLNRRTFLKTSATVIPMTTALNALDTAFTFSGRSYCRCRQRIYTPARAPTSADASHGPGHRTVAAEDSSRETEHHDTH